MKANSLKKIVLGLFCMFCSALLFAQDLSGDWQGVFNTDMSLVGKRRSFSMKMHLEQKGRKIKGSFWNAQLDFPDKPNVGYSISGLISKNSIAPYRMMRGQILLDNLIGETAEIFWQFDEIHYLKNDTIELLYGKWLPNNATSPRPDGAGGTFWVRKMISPQANRPDTVHKTYITRTTLIADTFRFSASSLTLNLYDNGEIDGDSVSVYVNDAPVIQHQLITAKPVILGIPVEKGKRYTISLFAENLGRIPPNTALLKIEAGALTKEIRLSASLDTNAAVIIEVE